MKYKITIIEYLGDDKDSEKVIYEQTVERNEDMVSQVAMAINSIKD